MTSPTWHTRASASSDGKHLAVWDDREKALRVYDLDTGKQLYARKGEVKYAPGIHIAADGKTVFFQEFAKPIQRCELRTGKSPPAIGMRMPSSARIEATADGRRALIRDRYHLHDQHPRTCGPGPR
jgi:hypothetical protein